MGESYAWNVMITQSGTNSSRYVIMNGVQVGISARNIVPIASVDGYVTFVKIDIALIVLTVNMRTIVSNVTNFAVV